MPVIDAHTHAFPDELAARAMPALEAEADWKAFLDGRLSSLLQSMDAAGVDVSVVCTIATKPDQADGILRWCDDIRSDRIAPFPSIHPDTPDPAGWLRRAAEAGFAGIKLHPMYQAFAIDEPRMTPIYAACAQLGLAVQMHCGRDVAFPPDDDRAEPARTRRVLDATPDLEFIATHMGGWRMWEESDRLLVGNACYMETSFSLDELSADRFVQMARAHGVDRVLFGTDSPWAGQAEDLQKIRALPFTPEELDKILYRNAARLLGL
ncbi:MAG: hypothetical protein AMJ81_03720 [Phycisphaerae bacterium SM23_33]|nr:MAG: hypothetical protein AMJ81_03720 [Phycisphaerae bacterium SM23_33]